MDFLREWRRFLSALRFMTLWPGGGKKGAPLAAGAAYFPLVGILVGVAAAITGGIFTALFSPALFGVVAALSLLIFTRAAQAEGLANVLEGLLIGRTPEARLRLMGESHLGSIAALSLLGLLLIKVIALSNIPSGAGLGTLVAAATLSRWTTTYLSYKEPYMAPSGELGFVGQLKGGGLAIATVIAVLVGGLALGLRGLVLLLILWAGSAAARAYFKRSLGGLTRVTYGAIAETAETLVLLTSVG